MEDTKSLLIMVLHKIFHDRPKTVEDTYQLIYNYNSGKRESAEYEKTLKTICDLMNDELPSDILVYLLTLVDMPQVNENQPPIIEKIQKTYNCLSKSVRPALLEYLSNKKAKNGSSTKLESSSIEEEATDEATIITATKLTSDTADNKENDTQQGMKDIPSCSTNKKSPRKIPTRTRSRRKLKNSSSKSFTSEDNESLGSLQDIAASYVIKHQQRLKLMYKAKLGQAWKLINSNSINDDDLKQCYKTVEDLNKKTKLLRCIENDNITDDMFLEDSSIFIKNKVVDHKDPFEIPENIIECLKMFLSNNSSH